MNFVASNPLGHGWQRTGRADEQSEALVLVGGPRSWKDRDDQDPDRGDEERQDLHSVPRHRKRPRRARGLPRAGDFRSRMERTSIAGTSSGSALYQHRGPAAFLAPRARPPPELWRRRSNRAEYA